MAAFAHLDDAAKNDLMGRVEKVLLPQSLFAGEVDDVLRISQHGAEQGALGLEAMVGGKALDGDGRGGSTPTLSPRMSFRNHRRESSVMERKPQ